MAITIKMQKVSDVPMPNYAHKGDSGVDLYSAEDVVLKPMERKLIPTGLKMAIPYGYEGQVRPKSGLALNHGIGHANSVGTIDSGYRGEIKVPVINLSSESYKIEKGKKIGQMIFAKVEEASFEEVEDLGQTTRNENGFGSTGLD
ncbi:MAG: dUTP diphosphatase [Candidatus Woesearchaeota archaeon]|jgi:dUTP pyrophosphatase|nr:dUTP diphosphatase [Candidatus Woesearchaeota archaeon]MDP7622513.1 dUTP diphosphatase [Candidatus Woesearchaeota archaeon]HJN56589.1 dUTP diphosphatase [Candidatus Woesearchaeota archaeon]|tara:strand:- start:44278 stop:44712 length:435 start_codon:yes stop_codon:yes gene_type:complete